MRPLTHRKGAEESSMGASVPVRLDPGSLWLLSNRWISSMRLSSWCVNGIDRGRVFEIGNGRSGQQARHGESWHWYPVWSLFAKATTPRPLLHMHRRLNVGSHRLALISVWVMATMAPPPRDLSVQLP